MTDGLDALDAKRQRRTTSRRAGVPPSRNPPATGQTPIAVGKPSPATSEQEPTPAPQPVSGPVNRDDDLVKTTIHLGATDDQFLDEVNFAGKRTRPKVDASRSAVTRLALRRLAEQMSTDEVVDELRKHAPASISPGRKRMA